MFSQTCSSIPDLTPRRLFFRMALALGGPAAWSCLLPTIASGASASAGFAAPPAGAGVGARHLSSISMKLVGLAFILVVLSACATPFDRYNIGTAELWIGGQVQVQQECARRGSVAYSNQAKIYGCADLQDRVIVSVSDPKIIAHEWCHWSTQSDSHELCPTPVVGLQQHP